ncbi:MAG: alpha-amylase family glycosyl hydrolase [Pseudomonadota bacterium]
MLFRFRRLILILCAGLALVGCAAVQSPEAQLDPLEKYRPAPLVQVDHPDWADDAIIYQINTRQFTPEGTFRAAQDQLPRLKQLGVDILWLMPVHPIGEVNRKGTLGSPYSIRDFYGVNPEFGTKEDLIAFVDAAHDLGFHVILDWVANHSSWDHPLVEQHADWYDRDWKGDYHPTPWTDWADIIDFDYSEPGLRQYMTEVMVHWVRDVGVDGFRADVAGFVPLDFWETLRAELNEIKPVFMLAEWQQRDLHRFAFDATYGWGWKEAALRIAKGESNAGDMTGFLSEQISTWPHDAYRMLYTENHDQNAWDGSTGALYGDAYRVFLTLSFVSEGIPLIHNGQEVGNQDQLEFFKKDPIIWGNYDHPDGDFLRQLIEMRKANKALWNGAAGGRIVPVVTDAGGQIVSFVREKDRNKVLGLFNLSPEAAVFTLADGPVAGTYQTAFSGTTKTVKLGDKIELAPWSSLVLIKGE